MIPLKDDNPTNTVPFITWGIICVNVIVFIYMLLLGPAGSDQFIRRYSVIPYELFTHGRPAAPKYLTVFTSMFVHGGFLHIGGNMLFLYIFGDNIEDYLGHLKYILFYLVCGVAAVLAQGLLSGGSKLPMLGASGAISGVLAAYMILYPKAGVWTFFFFLFFWQVIKVPAIFIIGLWIVIQVANGLMTLKAAGGGVAWFAHVGGFLAGVMLILLFRKRNYKSDMDYWRTS